MPASTTAPATQFVATERFCKGVTFRAVALSLFLAAWFGYIIPIIDLQVMNTHLGGGHLPLGGIGALLFFLLVVNPLLSRLHRNARLSRNEILTVYISCLFSNLLPGNGSETLFVSHIIGPFYFSTRENGWFSMLSEHLPSWFSPALGDNGQYSDSIRGVIEGWYTGVIPGASGAPIPWALWIVPLVAWSVLILASYWMLACLSVMLRAQWGENEALSFPLLKLPLEMTEDVDRPDSLAIIGRFFRNPIMWIGFAVAVAIDGLNGLNVYFPDVPSVPLGINTGAMFTETPWNQMAPMGMAVWPMFIGIAYLLTAEVSFSLWFFLWLVQSQYIVAYYLGFPYGTLPTAIGHSSDGGARTFTAFQQIGAYLSYSAILMWTARGHLRHIFRRALGRERPTETEKGEALSYPVAFWGFVGGFLLMVAWSWAAGMSISVAVAIWGLYLVAAIVLTRAVVEGGIMFINQGWVPLGVLGQLFGAGTGSWLGPNSIVPGSFFQVSFFQDMRGFLMPSFLQSFKLAHDRGIQARRLFALISGVILVSLAMSIWVKVRMGYVGGGLGLHPWFSTVAPKYPGQVSQELIQGARDSGIGNWLWLSIGGLATYGIVLARARLVWFPLHPLGYMLALTAPTQRAWFSFFLGWMFKTLITKFGGHESYRKLVPGFLGLVLGEASMAVFWLLIDAWQGRGSHGLLP